MNLRSEIRKSIRESCRLLITCDDIAEEVYMQIMIPLEEVISDWEDEANEPIKGDTNDSNT